MSNSDRQPRLRSPDERGLEVLDRPILGQSAPVLELHDLITKAARTDSSVLIIEETGVGKERVAGALHQGSSRAEGPFVPVNCSAVTETLLEAELFGHVRGAFTDARRNRAGLFVAASGGTLFLDEIGEMSLAVQAKVLRALDTRRVRRVGDDCEVPFDARVIAATNLPLDWLLRERRLREDLFYRIAVICIEVPPLRERGDDVLLMARHFLAEFARQAGGGVREFSADAADWIRAHPWPGNVRELKNCVERAVALSSSSVIGVADVSVRTTRLAEVVPVAGGGADRDAGRAVKPGISRYGRGIASDAACVNGGRRMRETESATIRDALAQTGGNKSAAARLLGISRRTIHRYLRTSERK